MSKGELVPDSDKLRKCRPRFYLSVEREDFCSYKGDCKINDNVHGNLCLYCKYRLDVDIPELIRIAKGE